MPSSDVPAHLGTAGGALFAEVAETFDLSIPERAALLQVCETVDTIAELEAALRTHGRVTADGKPSPLVAEARQQRAILVRLLGLLDLPLDDAAPAKALGASRAGQKAARARWSGHTTSPRRTG